jgi:hypothetical protein
VQRVAPADLARRAWPPALAAMLAQSTGPRAFACIGPQCSLPATSVEAWEAQLRPLANLA